jgi:hypothetical protein
MNLLPTRTYQFPEESPAIAILEKLGVNLGTDTEGQRKVELDPILMVAVLALQGEIYPMVSQLIEVWKKENSTQTEQGEIDGRNEKDFDGE